MTEGRSPLAHRPSQGGLQGMAVELALAAPFLSLRELRGWRGRLATWRRRTVEDVALLDRLDAILARYTR